MGPWTTCWAQKHPTFIHPETSRLNEQTPETQTAFDAFVSHMSFSKRFAGGARLSLLNLLATADIMQIGTESERDWSKERED